MPKYPNEQWILREMSFITNSPIENYKTHFLSNSKSLSVSPNPSHMRKIINDLKSTTKPVKKFDIHEFNVAKKYQFQIEYGSEQPVKLLSSFSSAPFSTGFLHWTNAILVSQATEDLYLVHRRLCLLPKPSALPKHPWSLKIRLTDKICSSGKCFNEEELEIEFTDSDFYKEFRYYVDEETAKIFSSANLRKAIISCHLGITIVKTTNLPVAFQPTFKVVEKSDASNVVVQCAGKEIHLLFELLALNSPLFYEKWTESTGESSLVNLDEFGDVPGFMEIVRLLLLRAYQITDGNVKSILEAAQKLQFPMVLTWCEQFLLTDSKMPLREKFSLAVQYEMSELQNALMHALPPQEITSHKSLPAESSLLPELKTTFHFENMLLGVNGGQRSSFTLNALFPWKLTMTLARTQCLFSLAPDFFGISRNIEDGYKATNWFINTIISFNFWGTQSEGEIRFSPGMMRTRGIISFPFEARELRFSCTIHISSIKGLRYYLNSSDFYGFDEKTPSSTVVLRTNKKDFFVNLNLLSVHSDYFKRAPRYLDSFDEASNLPIMEMDVEAEVLEHLLKTIYPGNRSLDFLHSNKVEDILRAADRYLFSLLMKDVELHYLKNPLTPPLKNFQYSLDFNMPVLKAIHLQKYHYIWDIRKLQGGEAYKVLSDQAKQELNEFMLTLPQEDDDDKELEELMSSTHEWQSGRQRNVSSDSD